MRHTWILFIFLAAILAIIVAAVLKYRSKKQHKKKDNVVLLSHTRKIKKLPAYAAAKRRYRILLVSSAIFFALAMSSIGVLAARPVSVATAEQNYESRDIMLCIDISGSMSYYLSEVLNYYKDTVSSLKGQRIGITLFATSSALFAPLTNDYDVLTEFITDFQASFSRLYLAYQDIVGGGSNIGDGVINCISNLGDLKDIDDESHSRAVIIATDNIQNGGIADITQAANFAKSRNVTLYGIDISYDSDTGARSGQYRRAMAMTGGAYYPLALNKSSARSAVEQIMKLEAAKHEGAKQFIQYDSPEVAAIVALISIAALGILIWRLQL